MMNFKDNYKTFKRRLVTDGNETYIFNVWCTCLGENIWTKQRFS